MKDTRKTNLIGDYVRRMAALVMVLLSTCASAEEADPSSMRLQDMYATQKEGVVWNSMSDVPYAAEYLLAYGGVPDYAGADIPCTVTSDGDRRTVITAEVTESAMYNVRWRYHHENPDSDLYANVTLDGETLYQEAAAACFRWAWEEDAPPMRNAVGDDVRTKQVLVATTNEDFFTDPDGYLQGALRIYLEAGLHELVLEFVSRPVEVLSCCVTAPVQTQPYEAVLTAASERGYKLVDTSVMFEAEENIAWKNSAMIQRTVSEDPLSTPFQMGYKRLNTMGGSNFSNGGQSVTWRFTVPEEGLYPISLRMATATDNLPVYRSLMIDGKVPFTEAGSCLFPYQQDLMLYTMPYLFPLTAGEHTLTLTVQIGGYYPIILALRDINDQMSHLVLDIVRIVGTNPDANYDYDIEKSIPDIFEQLDSLSGQLLAQCDALNDICGGVSLAENSLRQNAELLQVIKRNVERIQNNMTDLTTIQSNLSTWETNLRSMPLQIDKFLVGGRKNESDAMASSVWQKAEAMLYQFMMSFSKDYDQVGGRLEDGEHVVLDVWVSMSNEVADVLKTLCDSIFTPETGIAINLNIMPAGQLNAGAVNALMLAIVSGNQPDVALGVAAGTPVELAIRDAVVDLSKLPGYDDLVSQYPANSLVANSFQGGVYGIPERLDFTVMFYRKDILSSLGLPLPETWEEVYTDILPVLYQNHLEMYIPQNYGMFLYQYGGTYYSEDGRTTMLGEPECYQAFKTMVEMYTKYAIPYTTNFYNRFRTGELPLGIGSFMDYMSLTVGAANLSGKWGVAIVPGVVQADGTINHATTGAVSSSAMMMTACERQDAAWEFLKWWLSAETQTQYALEVEMRIGTGARINTANTEAFKRLSWPNDDLETLLTVRENAIETPGVLGGMYTSRHINNAWNAVITSSDQNVIRDEFEHAIEMVQIEMDNKQEEYAHLLQ